MRCILTLLTVLAVSPVVLAGQQTTVAVIGTGNMGGALGPKLAEAGYSVVYGSREPARADVRELVASTGHGASAASQEEATAQAQVVILAVHWEVMEEVLSNLGDVSGKILVDISDPNRVAADGYMEVSVETSGGEVIQAWRPEARVVKTAMPSAYQIPLLQGREQGVEFAFLRSSFWPCFWDVQEQFGTPPDVEDLAQLPVPAPPRPCEFWAR